MNWSDTLTVAPGGDASVAATSRAQREKSRRSHRIRNLAAAIRGFGMMVVPSALFDLSLVGSVASAAWTYFALRRRRPATGLRLLRPVALAGSALAVTYPALVRPWMLRWGATDEEVRKPLPGDELVPRPGVSSTRAISVNAPVEMVWPWLAQIGQDRGGFYSYAWLENLAGCHMRNADHVHPEWQRRTVGEVVKLHPLTGCKVAAFEPNHALVLEGWGAFVVEPQDALHSRVILRSRVPRGWPTVFDVLLIELPHFIMERKMLHGIKERAELAYGRARL